MGKRRTDTVFLLCYPEDKVETVKAKLAAMFFRDIGSIRLMYKETCLDDDATIRAQQISSNDVVHLVFKQDGSDQFEKVEFEDLDRMHMEFEAKMRQAA